MNAFIARVRPSDGQVQAVSAHLVETSDICKLLSRKIGVPLAGAAAGLFHDFGKYDPDFQSYLMMATGLLEPDADVSDDLKGKIDHSTAGAQYVYQVLSTIGSSGQGQLCAQIISICIASHHSGLIDNMSMDGSKNIFNDRMNKKVPLNICIQNADTVILEKGKELLGKALINEMLIKLNTLTVVGNDTITHFNRGLFVKFLFSCLIDADRISSADFEFAGNVYNRSWSIPNWDTAISRFENKYKSIGISHPIDSIRKNISDECLVRSSDAKGLYTLTVPTGGGKTLSSLRFALHHARTHSIDKIFYIVPFNTIIDQNAEVMRDFIESPLDKKKWILEHHCNVDPSVQTWRSKLSSENWDSPIVLTSMVQFLECIFGSGTRSIRRLHQLANSVIVFDEIQSIPTKCIYLFNNVVNFLVNHAGSTVILCTATQPEFNKSRSPRKGQLNILPQNELISDVDSLFSQLKRVNIIPLIKPDGWKQSEIIELIISINAVKGNCLTITNTKRWATDLYKELVTVIDPTWVFHLSTNMCPAHRRTVLSTIKSRLDSQLPVICISTQLIEAGVDIDFNGGIRFNAGMDSINQAGGRCNRNGKLPITELYVINPRDEKIEILPDIKIGQQQSLRIFNNVSPADLLNPSTIQTYFQWYYYNRDGVMDYKLDPNKIGRDDSLLNLLSHNPNNVQKRKQSQYEPLRQSFKTAASSFQVIDSPTRTVITEWGAGAQLIQDLINVPVADIITFGKLMRQAQAYSINVFDYQEEKLKEQNLIHEIGEGVYFIDKVCYDNNYGLNV